MDYTNIFKESCHKLWAFILFGKDAFAVCANLSLQFGRRIETLSTLTGLSCNQLHCVLARLQEYSVVTKIQGKTSAYTNTTLWTLNRHLQQNIVMFYKRAGITFSNGCANHTKKDVFHTSYAFLDECLYKKHLSSSVLGKMKPRHPRTKPKSHHRHKRISKFLARR